MAFKMKGGPMKRNFPGAFKKETNHPLEEKHNKRQQEIDEAFSSNFQSDPNVKRDQRLKEIKLTLDNLNK